MKMVIAVDMGIVRLFLDIFLFAKSLISVWGKI